MLDYNFAEIECLPCSKSVYYYCTGGEAVLCYACTYQGPHPDLPDYQCVVAPINVTTGSPTVNCPNGCTASSEVEIGEYTEMMYYILGL